MVVVNDVARVGTQSKDRRVCPAFDGAKPVEARAKHEK